MILLVYQLFFILTNTLFCKAVRNKSSIIPNLRIVGGHTVNIINAPFIASLQRRRGRFALHICGAVIITKTYLLTAAHCITDYDRRKKKGYSVALPKNYLISCGSSYTERGIIKNIRKFFVHSDYDPTELFCDYGAIAVSSDIAFNGKTRPAKLPEGNFTETSDLLDQYTKDKIECKAYGWGATTARSHTGLKVVGLHLLKTEVCQKILAAKLMGRINDEIQLCTLEEKGRKDACQGDSGGPLSCYGVIWGLVSWGEGCARPGNPGIFARTDVAKKWLEEVVFQMSLNSDSSMRTNVIFWKQKNIIILILNACFILRITEYLSK
ncbi:unnamed protein product [Nezara viridula]|uniref:trypsin n=1 Tax=Nezara viridula TaxID=85310 RepID=A0A9P0DZW3_NEZVI|nr:unnamed protein product [Nezara viridula]